MKIPSIFANAAAKQAQALQQQQQMQVLQQRQVQAQTARLAMQQQMLQSQQQIHATAHALQNQYGWVNSTLSAASNFAPPPREFKKVQAITDLDHAVFKTPLDTLVNLWIAKYGSDWVDKEKVLDDEFFEWAALRLRQLGRLEEHSIFPTSPNDPRMRIVLRIVDKE